MLLVLTGIGLMAGASIHVTAQEWFFNGGFEAGTAGWHYVSGSGVACTAYEGNAALGLSGPGRVRRELEGPFPASTAFTLSGWTRIQSGTGSVKLAFSFIDGAGGSVGSLTPLDIPSGSSYTPFSRTITPGVPTDFAVVAFVLEASGPAELCIDSLSLVSPDPTPTPTASPTATTVPGATATPTATATTPPGKSPTAVPSATPPKSATPTRTPVSSSPSFTFVNGGFEQGLLGWSKFGGTLTTTNGSNSGAAAGLLSSTTDSAKWAYQSVAIDPGQYYEFSGHLQPGGSAAETYLRISWYASPDASGEALSTTDSTSRAPGSSAGYVYLTTGPIEPPAGAASARVRVMLVPLGASPASVRIDDVWFGTTVAPSPTPTTTASPTATATTTSIPTAHAAAATSTPLVPTAATLATGTTASPTPEPAAAGSAAGSTPDLAALFAAPAQTAAASSPGPISEVGGARTNPAPPDQPPAAPQPVSRPDTSSSPPWPWVAGACLLLFGLGGTYLQTRNAR